MNLLLIISILFLTGCSKQGPAVCVLENHTRGECLDKVNMVNGQCHCVPTKRLEKDIRCNKDYCYYVGPTTEGTK